MEYSIISSCNKLLQSDKNYFLDTYIIIEVLWKHIEFEI